MDRRAAKREAWWRAAGVVRAALDTGWGGSLRERYGEADAALIEECVEEVVGHMEGRGRT